jgi:hypothetical protein
MRPLHGKFAPTSMDTIVLQAVHILRTASRIVDKPKRPAMNLNHHTAASRHHRATGEPRGSVDQRIRAFLTGESHGEDVLKALYGDVADEPVPERLRALLKH